MKINTISFTTQRTPVIASKNVTGLEITNHSTAIVYFTGFLDANSLIRIYNKVNEHIYGKVAIKLHTGEKNGPNIIPPKWVQKLQSCINNSTIVETNTLYRGDRYTTEEHRKTLRVNGWDFCPVDILDEEGDIDFPLDNTLGLKSIAMGSHLLNYDSMLVLTHFKGHAMGGFGGSMKNIAIGCASGAKGKAQVHGLDPGDIPEDWTKWPTKKVLMENMAYSAQLVTDFFGKRITFINVLRNMSIDCDCTGMSAAPPVVSNIGILASTDLLAIEQASVDLVYNASNNKDLLKRIESREGLHQLTAMRKLKMGNPLYKIVSID